MPGRGDAGARRHLLRDALHQRAIAARVVERRQQQRHHQQPAQADAARRQHQALPQRMAVAAGAPAHEPEPGRASRRAPRTQRDAARSVSAIAGRRAGRRWPPSLARHAGLHRDVEDPDRQRRAIVKKKTENQSIAAAALRCSVGSANAASTASAGRPSISARSRCRPSPRQAPSSVAATASGHDDVAAGEAAAPAPERPQRQRPGRPGEPGRAGARGSSACAGAAVARRAGSPRRRARSPTATATTAPIASQASDAAHAGASREREQAARAPTAPSSIAMLGAPLAASAGSAASTASARASHAVRRPPRAPYRKSATRRAGRARASSRGRAAAGPSDAISASSAPSAIARA